MGKWAIIDGSAGRLCVFPWDEPDKNKMALGVFPSKIFYANGLLDAMKELKSYELEKERIKMRLIDADKITADSEFTKSVVGLFKSCKMKRRVFSAEQVRKIRELCDDGLTDREIAARMNASRGSIYQIRKGLTYREVQ